jgi:dehydrogenase/reductase SDR family member 7B
MIQWQNKVVWITGASSGIGEALTIALSTRGAHLVLSARRLNELERVKNRCQNPAMVTIVPIDLASKQSVELAFQQVLEKKGRIDALFNNGGISQRSLALETEETTERALFEINYFNNVLLGKKTAEMMKNQGGGHIVVTSSLLGKWGFHLRSTYAATKHALHGFYESMRLELEPSNVRISLVTPGFIATPISVHALDKAGNPTGEMDANQSGGISAEACAEQILKHLDQGKDDFGVGGRELFGLTIRRWFPQLFHRILRKKSTR